jgi:hypothetical protein
MMQITCQEIGSAVSIQRSECNLKICLRFGIFGRQLDRSAHGRDRVRAVSLLKKQDAPFSA